MPEGTGAAFVAAIEGFLIRMKKRRLLRIPMYGALVPSGIFALVDPSELVINQVSYTVANLWAIGMIISSAMCLYGAITDKWIGEFGGLPLLIAVVWLYGGSALSSFDVGGFIIIAYGLAVVSFGFGLLDRWLDVLEVVRNSDGGIGKGRNR